MGKRIGLFGGTFDPVHIGHMRSAVEMAEQFALDELRLLPNARPPTGKPRRCRPRSGWRWSSGRWRESSD